MTFGFQGKISIRKINLCFKVFFFFLMKVFKPYHDSFQRLFDSLSIVDISNIFVCKKKKKIVPGSEIPRYSRTDLIIRSVYVFFLANLGFKRIIICKFHCQY